MAVLNAYTWIIELRPIDVYYDRCGSVTRTVEAPDLDTAIREAKYQMNIPTNWEYVDHLVEK